MKRLLFAAALLMAAFTLTYLSSASARDVYLPSVNTACGTSFDCGVCHVNPFGGGPLTPGGEAWVEFGRDDTILCPVTPPPSPVPSPSPSPSPGGGGEDSDGDSGGDSDSGADSDADSGSDD